MWRHWQRHHRRARSGHRSADPALQLRRKQRRIFPAGLNVCGTVFSVDPTSGEEAILHAFTGGTDGGNPPYAPLVALGGVLYGTTGSAGAHGLGTVFSLAP
jgi:uncharacterized repeat protein (TIGR03803 family)